MTSAGELRGSVPEAIRADALAVIEAVKRDLGRELTTHEWLQCFMRVHIEHTKVLVEAREKLRLQELEDDAARRVREADPNHWRKAYEYDGCCYTLDAMRLVDRRPTNPMAFRRGRVLEVKGEWLTVEWRDTRGHALTHALEMGWAGEPHRRDEYWKSLSIKGHSACCNSDIPGFGCGPCDETWGFDPTTGVVTNRGGGGPPTTHVYRPAETVDLRKVLA